MNQRATEQTDALVQLKKQADELGINYHPNIGFSTLEQRVETALAAKAQSQETTPEVVTEPIKEDRAHVRNTGTGRLMTPNEVREMRKKRNLELVRVRVSCMNPNKKDWKGEIFSIGNSEIPTQKKYVPFNSQEGWHIPRMMVNWLKEKKYQTFVTETDHRGREVRRGIQQNEFAVEILPPLTAEEFKELKRRQALKASKTE